MENTLQNKAKLFETSAEKEVLQVENKTFENYERPSLIDLQKVFVCRDKILELIFSTNIHEDIIESLLRPFENLLESNGVNLQETDY